MPKTSSEESYQKLLEEVEGVIQEPKGDRGGKKTKTQPIPKKAQTARDKSSTKFPASSVTCSECRTSLDYSPRIDVEGRICCYRCAKGLVADTERRQQASLNNYEEQLRRHKENSRGYKSWFDQRETYLNSQSYSKWYY